MIRAVILAAGRGSRLAHLGDDRPKCLVELEGKPLIERQMAALRRGGVDEIGVVRGYRAEMIDFPGLCYFANDRWAETNMVMSLAAAASWLRAGPVIVSYADIFYRGDLVRGLAATPGELVISFDRAWRRLWTRRFADPLADAETFRMNAAGELIEIGGKTTRIEEIEGQYMGSLKIHSGRLEHRRGVTRHTRPSDPRSPGYDGFAAPAARRKGDPHRHFRHRWPMGRNR